MVYTGNPEKRGACLVARCPQIKNGEIDMYRISILTGLIVVMMGLSACSSVQKTQTSQDLDAAPEYTQEEKDAMTEEERIALYNESMSQQKNKVVCRREKPLGSHMTKTVCRTQAEMDRDRDEARDALIESGARNKPQGAGN
jgi:hypothetical protein